MEDQLTLSDVMSMDNLVMLGFKSSIQKEAVELSVGSRKGLPDSAFALPGRRYSIQDRKHAANAVARVSAFGSTAEKTAVLSAVSERFPDLSS